MERKKKGERGGEEGMVEAERTERERERAGEIRREQENDGKEREGPPAFSTSLHLISNRHQTTR